MRINHLEESLISIQDEDESLLRDTSKKELDIKYELNCELLVNSENKNKIQELTYIKSIKESKLKLIYFLFPFLEIPLAIMTIIMAFITGTTVLTGVSINLFAGLLLLDATHNVIINYKKVSNIDNLILRIVNTMRFLFMNKKKFAKELERYLKKNEISNNRVKELTNKLNELNTKKESLIEELENIEGYILGVQKIISRNLIDSIPDNNFAVEFVNLRLKK